MRVAHTLHLQVHRMFPLCIAARGHDSKHGVLLEQLTTFYSVVEYFVFFGVGREAGANIEHGRHPVGRFPDVVSETGYVGAYQCIFIWNALRRFSLCAHQRRQLNVFIYEDSVVGEQTDVPIKP